MSRTYKNCEYRKFWEHAPAWYNQESRRKFRHIEKQYFEKYGETLVPTKDRGWGYW